MKTIKRILCMALAAMMVMSSFALIVSADKAEEKPAEDSEEVKALKQELNVVKEENEALKAKVEELEAKIKEYEEKEKETDPSAEDAEKFSKQKEDKYAKVMTRMSYLKK